MISDRFDHENENEDPNNPPLRAFNSDSELENDANQSDMADEIAVHSHPLAQPLIKEELEFKDFKFPDRTDKNKLRFSYLTKFFQKFSELKGRKKSE